MSKWTELLLMLLLMAGFFQYTLPAATAAEEIDCSKVEYKLTTECKSQAAQQGLNTSQLDPCDIKIDTANCVNNQDNPRRNLFVLITNILNTLFFILGFVAVILIIFEGVLLIIENKEDRRKKIISTIVNIALGFGTIILSYAIVSFILGFIFAQTPDDRNELTSLNGQYTGDGEVPAYNLYGTSLYNLSDVSYVASSISGVRPAVGDGGVIAFNEPKGVTSIGIAITDKNYSNILIGGTKGYKSITHKISGGSSVRTYNYTDGNGFDQVVIDSLPYSSKVTLTDTITMVTQDNKSSTITARFTVYNSADAISNPGGSNQGGNQNGTLPLSSYMRGDVEYTVKADSTPPRDIGRFVAESIIPLTDGENDVKVIMTVNDDKNYARIFTDTKKIEHRILKSTGEVIGSTSSEPNEKDVALNFTVAKGDTLTLVDQISAIGASGDARIISTNRLFFSNSMLPKVGNTSTSVDASQRLLVEGTYTSINANQEQKPATLRLLSNQSLYIPVLDPAVAPKLTLDPKLYGGAKPSFLRIETKDSQQKQVEMKEIRKELLVQGDNQESIDGQKPMVVNEKPVLSFPAPGVYSLKIDWLDDGTNNSISSFSTSVTVYGDKTRLIVSPHVSKLGSTFRIDTYPQFSEDALLQKKTLDLIYLGQDGTKNQNEYSKDLLSSDGDILDYAFLKPGYYTVKLSALYQGVEKPTVVEDRVLVYPLAPVIDFMVNPRSGNPAIYDVETTTKYVIPESIAVSVSPNDGSTIVNKTSPENAVLTFTKAGTYKITVSGRNDFGQIESNTKTIRVDSLLSYDISFLGAQKEEIPDNAGIIFQSGQNFTAQVQGRSIDKIGITLPGVNQSIPNMDGPTVANGLQTFQKEFKFNQSGYFVLQFSIYETGKTVPISISKSIFIKDDAHPAAAFDISLISNAGNIPLQAIPNLCKAGSGYVEGYLVRKNKDYILDGSYSLKNNGLPVDGTNTFTWNIDGDTSFSSQDKQTIQFKNLSLLPESCQQMRLTVVDKGVASTLTKYVRVQNSLPSYSTFSVEKPFGTLTSPVTVKANFENLADPDRSGLPRIRWFYLVQGKEMQSEISQEAFSRNITIMPYGSSGAVFIYQIGAQVFDSDLENAPAGDAQKSYTVYSEPFFVRTPQVAEPSIRISSPRGSDGGKIVPWLINSPVNITAQSILMTGDPVSAEAAYIWKVEKTAVPLNSCNAPQAEAVKTFTDSGLTLPYTFTTCGVYAVSVTIDDKGKTATDNMVFQVKTAPSDLTPAENGVVQTYSNNNSNASGSTSGTSGSGSTTPQNGALSRGLYELYSTEYNIRSNLLSDSVKKYIAHANVPVFNIDKDIKIFLSINDEQNYTKTFQDTARIEHKILKGNGEIIGTIDSTEVNKDKILEFTIPKGESPTIVDQVSAVSSSGTSRVIGTNRLFFYTKSTMFGTASNPNLNSIISDINNGNADANDDENLPDTPPTYTLSDGITVPVTNPNTNQPAYLPVDTSVKPSAPSTADIDEIKKLIQNIITSDPSNPSAPVVPQNISGYNIIGPTSLVGCTNTVLVLNANAEARLACNDYNLYSNDASVIAEYLKRKDENLYNDQFKALFEALNGQTSPDARLDTFEQILKKINASTLSDADKAQLQKIASYIAVTPVDKTLENKMVVDAVDNLKAGLINALTDAEKNGNTLLSKYFNELAGLKNSTVSVDIKSDKMEQALRDIMNSTLIPDSTKQQINNDVNSSTVDLVAKVSEIIRNTTTLSETERKEMLERINTLQSSYQNDDPVTRAKKIQDALLSILNQPNIGNDVKTLITKEVNNSISQISDKTSERIGQTFTQVEGQGSVIVKTLDGNLKSHSGLSNTLNALKDLQNSITNASWIPAAEKTKIEASTTTGLHSWLQEMKRSIETSTVLSSAEKDAYYKDIDALLAAKDSRVLIPQLEKQLSVWINDKRLTSDPVLYEKVIGDFSIKADGALRNARAVVNAVPITSSADLASRAALVTQIDQKRQTVFPSSSILRQVAEARTGLASIPELADKTREVDAKIVSSLNGSVGEIEAMFNAEGGAIFKPYLDKYKQALAEASTSPDSAGKALAALNDLYAVILKQDGRYTNLKAKLGGYVESFSRTTYHDINRVTKTSNAASFAAEKKIISDTIDRIKNSKMTVQEAAHELDSLKKFILASEKLPQSVKLEMINALETDPTFRDYFKALRECTAVYVRGKDGTLQRMCNEELKNYPDLKPVATDDLFSEMQRAKQALMSSIDTLVKDPELKKALNILLERLVTDKTLTMDKRLKNTRLLLSLLEHPSLSSENRATLLSKLYAIPVIGDEIKLIQENELAAQNLHGAAPRELDQVLKDILAATRPLATTERSVVREMLLQIKNFYGKKPERVDASVSLTSRLVTDSTLSGEVQKKVQEMLIGLGRTDVAIDYGAVKPEITLDKLSRELDALQGRQIYAPSKAAFDTLLKATSEKDFLAAQGAAAKLQDMIQKSSELNEPEKTPIVLDTSVTKDFYTYISAKIAPENTNANQNQAPLEELPPASETASPSGFVGFLFTLGTIILWIIVSILVLGGIFYLSFVLYKRSHPDEHIDFEEYILNIRESVKKFFAGFRKENTEDLHTGDSAEEALPRLPKSVEVHEETESAPVTPEVVEAPSSSNSINEDSPHDDNVIPPADGAAPSWLQMTPQISETNAEQALTPTLGDTPEIPQENSIPAESAVSSTPAADNSTPFFDPFADTADQEQYTVSASAVEPSQAFVNPFEITADENPSEGNNPEVQNAEETPIFDPFAEVNILPFDSVPDTSVIPAVAEKPAPEKAPTQPQTTLGVQQRATPQRPYIPRNLQTAEQQLQSRGPRPKNQGGIPPKKPMPGNRPPLPKQPPNNTL